MNSNKHESQAVKFAAIEAGEETVESYFLSKPELDYVTFELHFPLKTVATLSAGEVPVKLVATFHGAKLKNPIVIEAGFEIGDVFHYINSTGTEKVLGYMEDVYRVLGFVGPGLHAQLFAYAIDGEIVTAMWSIKKDKKLSKKQADQIFQFLVGKVGEKGGGQDQQFLVLEYGGSAAEYEFVPLYKDATK